MSLLRSIAAGAAWTTGAQWFVQLSQFAVSILLARLLVPADYGLVGMALVITSFVALFGNLGLGAALIQKKEIDEETISTAFWTTVAAGILLLAIVYVAAPFAAEFYRDPRVADIARVAALGLLFGPMNSIVTSLLERHMRYRAVAALDIATALLGQATAVAFALAGMGVWSLVAGTLVAQATRIPLAFAFERWTPGLGFNFTKLKELLSFGGYLLAFNFVNYFCRNFDKLIIGRALGPIQLGYYDLAYQTMLKPLQAISSTVSRPLFPALSSLRDDTTAAAETYRVVVTGIALVAFPSMLGFLAIAPDFVGVVLGSKWDPATPVLQILCIIGTMQSVGATVGDVYLSRGRSNIMFWWGSVVAVATVISILVGINWGIIGVATAYGLVSGALWVASHWIANGLLRLSNIRFWKSLLTPASLATGMSASVFALREWMIQLDVSPPVRLITGIAFGAAIYILLLTVSRNSDVVFFRRNLVNVIGKLKLRMRR